MGSANAVATAISVRAICPNFAKFLMWKSGAVGDPIGTPQPPLKLALQKGRTDMRKFNADAVRLCEGIISGKADLAQMNRQSLIWRGKKHPNP